MHFNGFATEGDSEYATVPIQRDVKSCSFGRVIGLVALYIT